MGCELPFFKRQCNGLALAVSEESAIACLGGDTRFRNEWAIFARLQLGSDGLQGSERRHGSETFVRMYES